MWIISVLVGLLVFLPVVFVLLQASNVGWSELRALVFRPKVAGLLWNTLTLTTVVSTLAVVIGVGAAWCIERTDLPGRHIWSVVLVLPLAVPEFVVGYAWVSTVPIIQGFGGAVLVMTLSLYPLVYLPASASLRGMDPALEETAQSFGLSPWRVFIQVTLPQLKPAVIGGGLVITLYLMGEYGAFAMLRFQTFTTQIFNELNLGFDAAAASALALVLILLCTLILAAELSANRHTRYSRVGSGSARPHVRHQLKGSRLPVMLALLVLVVLALGVPLGAVVYWLLVGGSTTLPSASILATTGWTLFYGLVAAFLATSLAIPVAMVSVRYSSTRARLLERSTYLVRALPGAVVGLSLVYFAVRYARFMYQTSALTILGYVMLFFPLALVAVRSALAQLSPQLEEVGRSLGKGSFTVFYRITLPLISAGLAAAGSLVFLATVTELTATLLLRPTGVETLATQFWVYVSAVAYGAAAPYAALLVIISGVPTIIILRRFERLVGLGIS